MSRTLAILFLALALASCCSVRESTAPPPPTAALSAATTLRAEADLYVDLSDVDSLEDVAALPWPEPQRVLKGFSARGRPTFWDKIYVDGGTEVYCRKPFSKIQAANRKIGGRPMNVEHAYPAKWIAKRYGCANRQCAKEPYKYAEADLHNLWPSYSSVNSSRGDGPFGMIPREKRSFEEFCPDYERLSDPETVEPDENARGDLARSIFYMHNVYGMPFKDVMRSPDLLLQWNRDDPPDAEERHREAMIREIQHTWNPLVMPRGPGM